MSEEIKVGDWCIVKMSREDRSDFDADMIGGLRDGDLERGEVRKIEHALDNGQPFVVTMCAGTDGINWYELALSPTDDAWVVATAEQLTKVEHK